MLKNKLKIRKIYGNIFAVTAFLIAVSISSVVQSECPPDPICQCAVPMFDPAGSGKLICGPTYCEPGEECLMSGGCCAPEKKCRQILCCSGDKKCVDDKNCCPPEKPYIAELDFRCRECLKDEHCANRSDGKTKWYSRHCLN